MWIRGILGVVLCVAGIVWVAQGTGAMHGSMMSGHGQYAVLGAFSLAIGVASFVWAYALHRARRASDPSGSLRSADGEDA